MKTSAKDYVSAAQQFFTAYDAHDVDGMLALCADGALGRYAPYGRESVVPIRGGIDVIWRAFPNAVPNFRVKVIELIPAEGNIYAVHHVIEYVRRFHVPPEGLFQNNSRPPFVATVQSYCSQPFNDGSRY